MELLNDVVIQCEECGNIIVIKKEYLDAETSSYERQMGPEIVYDIYEECDCEECGNNIKYRISGYEYPVGCFNYEDNEIHGGQFLEKGSKGNPCCTSAEWRTLWCSGMQNQRTDDRGRYQSTERLLDRTDE